MSVDSLKPGGNPPITRMGTGAFMTFPRHAILALLCACLGAAEAAKPKPKPKQIPILAPSSEAQAPAPSDARAAPAPGAAEAGAGKPGTAFAELNFNRTLVIEGKVEKPQVTFTLLKEPPPEKVIRFEASFLENILKLDRENTFSPGETYGRE